jgi:hypothetical protein
MAHKDPFNNVLHKLGWYQRIQGMNLISTAAIPAAQNNTLEVPCRTRWNLLVDTQSDVPSPVPTDKLELVLQIIKFVHPTPQTTTRIRPISLILNLGKTVQAESVHRVSADSLPCSIPYPDVHDTRSSAGGASLEGREVCLGDAWKVNSLLATEYLKGCPIMRSSVAIEKQPHFLTWTKNTCLLTFNA